MRILTVFALCAALATSAVAQRGGFAGGHSGGGHGFAPAAISPLPSLAQHRGGFVLGRAAYGSRFNRYGPYGPSLWPLFGDYDLDSLYASGYPVSAEPPMMYLQAAREMAGLQSAMGSVTPETAPPEPLMIELQGDNYVRVNSPAANGEAQPINEEGHLQPATTPSSSATHISRTPARAQELPPAVLIFRDGHSEQVRDYTIADGILYARGDFYTDGYWNKQIDLASLDLPQTLQANASRNVNFVLPSSPNEVIARF